MAAMCGLPVQGFAGNVNTADIIDGAVTTPKVADGAITAPKLGIVCPDGQYLKYTAGSGWACNVGTPGLQGPQGVKGDAGLTGPQGPVGPMPHYANVVVVAKSGGDFTDPVAALNSITDASDEKPYLVQIMPGIYDINETIVLTNNISIAGSGESVTKIRQNSNATMISFNQTLPQKSSLRNITLEPLVEPYKSIIETSGSPVIESVTVTSTVGGTGAISEGGSPLCKNVNFNFQGGVSKCVASVNSDSILDGVNCNAVGIYGIGFETYINTSMLIKNSTVNATTYALFIAGMNDTPPVINFINSQVIGGTLQYYGMGIIKCFGSYDRNYNPLNCQRW